MTGTGTAKRSRVGDFSQVWGESLRWDDRRQRLYFVSIAVPIAGLEITSPEGEG